MKPFYFITLFAVLGMGMTTLQAQTTTVTCPEITDISCYHKDARGYECTTKNEKWTSIGHYPAQPYLMRFIGLASYPDPQNPKKRIVTGCTYRTTGKTLTLASKKINNGWCWTTASYPSKEETMTCSSHHLPVPKK